MKIFNHGQNAQAKLFVLLVEDDFVAQKVHRLMLERMGFIVDVANDGKQALIKNSNKYSVIFLDCGLPDLDGFEVCKCIRQYEMLNNVNPRPVIMLSAYPYDEEIQEKCKLSGISEFISKPVELNILKTITLHWLDSE